MPIEINKETLDYLSDQLASTVRGTVEATIFRTYRNAAAVAVAVLGAVGITVGWPTIRSTIDAEIAAKVDKPVAAAEELAKKAREDADHILVETDIRMDALRNEMSHLEARRDALQDAVNKMEENSQAAETEISSHIEANKRSLQDLEQSISQRAQTLDQRFATIGVSDEISNQLKSLSQQVAKLEAALRSLADQVNHPDALASAAGVSEEVKKIETKLQTMQTTINAQPNDASHKGITTVFVQFAGGSRGQIADLTKQLQQNGDFALPGEERTESAINMRNIRYYYPEDAAAAETLRGLTNAALKQLGYSIEIAPLSKQWLTFPKKPQHGVIELWLELPKKATAG
jgi:hypothetical protein